jgi:hypothetical protein
MNEINKSGQNSIQFLSHQNSEPQSALEKLKQKVIEEYGFNEENFDHFREYKLSSVLHDFLEPYIDGEETEEEYYSLITLGVLAWNLSFLSKKAQKKVLDELFQPNALMIQDRSEFIDDIKAVVRQMIVSKKRYFAKYKRYIIDFELKDEGDEFRLAVVSQAIN